MRLDAFIATLPLGLCSATCCLKFQGLSSLLAEFDVAAERAQVCIAAASPRATGIRSRSALDRTLPLPGSYPLLLATRPP